MSFSNVFYDSFEGFEHNSMCVWKPFYGITEPKYFSIDEVLDCIKNDDFLIFDDRFYDVNVYNDLDVCNSYYDYDYRNCFNSWLYYRNFWRDYVIEEVRNILGYLPENFTHDIFSLTLSFSLGAYTYPFKSLTTANVRFLEYSIQEVFGVAKNKFLNQSSLFLYFTPEQKSFLENISIMITYRTENGHFNFTSSLWDFIERGFSALYHVSQDFYIGFWYKPFYMVLHKLFESYFNYIGLFRKSNLECFFSSYDNLHIKYFDLNFSTNKPIHYSFYIYDYLYVDVSNAVCNVIISDHSRNHNSFNKRYGIYVKSIKDDINCGFGYLEDSWQPESQLPPIEL